MLTVHHRLTVANLFSQAPTIYPILFAAVVGKALRSIAFWRLEKGGRVGLFDQLLGSTTIFQTVTTQVQIRTPGFIGIALIITWAFSPLGGQASLRVLRNTTKKVTEHSTIQYVNTTSWIMSGQYVGADTENSYIPVDALFGAALVSYATTKYPTQDTWGNIKVPFVEQLAAYNMDSYGWYSVPDDLSSDHYASVLGLPISAVTNDANTTTVFGVETSYWVLTCPLLWGGNRSDPTTYKDYNFPNEKYAFKTNSTNLNLSSNNSRTSNQQTQGLDPGMQPLVFTYTDQNNHHDDEVLALCTIQTSYVEVSVRCLAQSCVVARIRRSQSSHPPSSWTPLDTASTSSFGWFATHFVGALKDGHQGAVTPYQSFILDPLDAFNSSLQRPPVSTVPKAIFSIRLSQLFNTYWIALLAPTAIAKGLNNANLTVDTSIVEGTEQQSTEATITHLVYVVKCDNLWLTVLLISTGVTTLIGIFGIVATMCRRGPELGLNISAMIKDSPFVDSPAISSTLDASDRTRMCKNLVVKYGDVACEDEFGHVAIGNLGVSDFGSRRLYV